MKPRFPLVAAVVSALLVGGATTGTTYAAWVDTAALPGDSITTGSMSFTVTTPAGVTVIQTAGAFADTSFDVADTSQGKNLQQRITATVTGTPAGISATVGTSCGGSVPADTTPGSGQTLCVRVRVTSPTTAVSGPVTLSLSGAQRPTAGWTTLPISRQFTVTVKLAPPTLSCGSSTNNSHTFSWGAVVGATSYTVYRSTGTNTDANFNPVLTGTTATSYTTSIANGATQYLRVKAVNTAGSSAFSNTLRVTRSGSAVTCTQVTP